MKKVTFEDGRGTGINQIAASWSNRAWNLDGGDCWSNTTSDHLNSFGTQANGSNGEGYGGNYANISWQNNPNYDPYEAEINASYRRNVNYNNTADPMAQDAVAALQLGQSVSINSDGSITFSEHWIGEVNSVALGNGWVNNYFYANGKRSDYYYFQKAQSNGNDLIQNSLLYHGLVGGSWVWGAAEGLSILSPGKVLARSAFDNVAASKAAGKVIGKVGIGLNIVATTAEGYDLYNNWESAGTGDVAKFGVDASLTLTTILFSSSAVLAATGVGAPAAGVIVLVATGIQVANTLGAFDNIYESYNTPIHGGGGGSW
jgi:hypothetical protein